MTISTDGVAILGGRYILNCDVIGIVDEDIIYEWFGPNPEMHKESSELTISFVGFHNVGTYMCSATIPGSGNISGTENVSFGSELLHLFVD